MEMKNKRKKKCLINIPSGKQKENYGSKHKIATRIVLILVNASLGSPRASIWCLSLSSLYPNLSLFFHSVE